MRFVRFLLKKISYPIFPNASLGDNRSNNPEFKWPLCGNKSLLPNWVYALCCNRASKHKRKPLRRSMGHSTGRFVAASLEYAAVALYLPVLHAEIMCFSSFIYNLYADLNSNRVARGCCCCCCCCCKCEVFTNSALMCAPISGSGRADKGEGARPRAWAKQWAGRPPTRSRLRTVARACTSAGARCPRIFRSLQREHKTPDTFNAPLQARPL